MTAPRGITNGNAKLTDKQVRDIRHRYQPHQIIPSNVQELALEYGVHRRTITRIVSGEDRGYVK